MTEGRMTRRAWLDFWYDCHILAFHEPTVYVGPHSDDVWLIQMKFMWPAPSHFLVHQHIAQLHRPCFSSHQRLSAMSIASDSIRDFLAFSRTVLANALHLGVWKIFVFTCAHNTLPSDADAYHTEEDLNWKLLHALSIPVSNVLECLGVFDACEAWPPHTVTRLASIHGRVTWPHIRSSMHRGLEARFGPDRAYFADINT